MSEIWFGLLLESGEEVQAPGYSRLPVSGSPVVYRRWPLDGTDRPEFVFEWPGLLTFGPVWGPMRTVANIGAGAFDQEIGGWLIADMKILGRDTVIGCGWSVSISPCIILRGLRRAGSREDRLPGQPAPPPPAEAPKRVGFARRLLGRGGSPSWP